jgi:Werner syndrome ATP-dependent helicase
MDSNNKSSDQVISEMVEMGFEHSKILEAIKVVGLSIPSIVEHIFNTSSSSSSNNREPSTTHISKSLPSNGKAIKKRTFSSSIQVPKSRTINHYFQSTSKVNEKNKNVVAVDVDDDVEEHMVSLPQMRFDLDLDIVSDWEQRASILLQKHFGFSSLKSFQKEALSAWIARRDCLVLAATGSGFVLYLYLQKCY